MSEYRCHYCRCCSSRDARKNVSPKTFTLIPRWGIHPEHSHTVFSFCHLLTHDIFFIERSGESTKVAMNSFFFDLANVGAFEAEKSYDMERIHALIKGNFPFFCGSVVFYLFMCFLGPMIMKSRNAFDLKYPLAAWNGLLSLFSAMGMIRTAPFLIGRLLSLSYEESICANGTATYGNGAVGLWTMLFILSKVPELVTSLATAIPAVTSEG
jgi:hypothetical protein